MDTRKSSMYRARTMLKLVLVLKLEALAGTNDE